MSGTYSKKKYHLVGFFFLSLSFDSAYHLRNNFDDQSLIIFLTILFTCISTDIGGYIFGNIFKGPKLTKISPKKTYSGMIGSYILSIITIYILFIYSYLYNDIIVKFTSETFLIVLLISTVSQILREKII